MHDRISRLTARVAMLRIHRRDGTLDSDDVRLLRADVIEEAGRLTSQDRSHNPGLVRELAAEVGDQLPSIARDALRLGGLSTAAPPPSVESLGPDDEPLTSVEQGELLSDAVSDDSASDVAEGIQESFRSDSDDLAF